MEKLYHQIQDLSHKKMSVKLKDGSIVEDSRLDRLVNFDERSRNFPIMATIRQDKPRSYTWRCDKWYDQGKEGACVAFSLSHLLAARPAEVLHIPNTKWIRHVYHEAQRIDPWPGGAYSGANPFYEGTAVLAGVKILHKKGFFKSYRWAFGLHDMIMGVGYSGPCAIGVPWFTSMYSPDSNGFVSPKGKCVGGHAIMVRGVNLKESYFILRNSWGQRWGRNGDCYMSFKDMEWLLNHKNGSESLFMVKRTSKYDFSKEKY